ncbi:adenosylmethionine--8-amino-7-oxononanoate transaminase [Altererythrobacter aquiaggeris]|uniref:adenosylmethionine--8-amino-7-oxononanoate transaminase n=1 Tax=Aestuarierythrobacter aquiaggeris TaxID=1898396 RepID=UPI003019AABD
MSNLSSVWHPFTQHGLEAPIPMVTHAEGSAIFTADGRRIIDGISSWWVTTHGHCNPRIMAAIARQTEKLDQIIFAGWTHEPAEQLAASLAALVPDPLHYAFFSDSGSTAVEVALKMALGHWVNRGEKRRRIAVMQHSYHGDTIGTMSVGERGVFNRAYEQLLFDVATIPFPAAGQEQLAIDALEAECAGGDVAALIVEPLLLGAGGMLIYSPAVLASLAEICRAADVLLIADEVMTGWGRTGTLFACEQANVVPDIMCLSKGLTGGAIPLAVTMATPRIFDAHFSKDPAKQFFHSSSYTANPIACAAANANLQIWRDEPVAGRIDTLAARQSAGLTRLASLPGVTGARQIGTVIAVDVESGVDAGYLSQVGSRLKASLARQDVLLRPLGNTIYVMPPYCTGQADLDGLHDAVEQAIGEALEK